MEEGTRVARVATADVEQALAGIAGRLIVRREALARAIIDRLREEILDYRLMDEELVYRDVYGVTLANLDIVLQSLVDNEPLEDAVHEVTREGAARRVEQGLPLKAFLHGARLWGRIVWQSVLDETDPAVPAEREAALQIAGLLQRHVDHLSTAAAEGYLTELQSSLSDHEVIRRDLLDDLISGNGDSERVRGLARSLRLKLADRYVVVVLRVQEARIEDTPEQPLASRVALRRIVDAARRHLRPADGSLLVGMRQGEVVAFYPLGADAALAAVHEQASALAEALADNGVSVGVGGEHDGLAAVASGFAEARDAAEIGLRTGARGRAVVFDDVLIDHLLQSSPHPERILDRTVGPLVAYDGARQAELLPTLRAYLASGFNLTRSAELMCVHPNTVVYRLRRIRELSGRDPLDPDDLLLLLLGLKLVDLGPAD